MRIAASTYLNSAPLVYSFSQGSLRHKYEFLGDAAPSRCAAMLAAGQCEIALIPVIEYQRIPGLLMIPDVAVASKERVQSVLLASRCSLQEVRRVTLDTSSRTSQTLVKILFERQYGLHPIFTERTPDFAAGCENMFVDSDAALVIGDPAMRLAALAPQLGVQIYDLAEEWRAMTGLPFVFAVWAARAEMIENQDMIATDFLAAKLEGMARLNQIAASYAEELRLPQQHLLAYLQDSVNYDLDPENIAGMRRYFALAAECGFIAKCQAIEFLGPRERIEAAGK